MEPVKRIYTRTGDDGTTAIRGGMRVPKTDIRIEANGTLDELNTAVGEARTLMADDDDRQPTLRRVQLELMTLMSLTATPSELRHANPGRITAETVARLERDIDSYTAQAGGEATHFLLPGGTPVAAALHRARVTARRAERRLWQLHESDPVAPEMTMYVNRLSDLMFEMARAEMAAAGLTAERWRAFRR